MRIPAVIPILLLGVILIAGCSGPQQTPQPEATTLPTTATPTPPPTTPPVQPTDTVPTPLSQGPARSNTVTIQDYTFTPQTITVDKGEIVRWENRDTVPHRIMFTDATGQDVDIGYETFLTPHQSYSRKFIAAGTYPYYCKIHPEMKGTVIVE